MSIVNNDGLEREIRTKFVKGLIDLIMLGELKDRQLCGYELIRLVYSKFQVLLSPGTIYPILQMCKERGLIEEDGVKEKRLMYRITKKGEDVHSAIAMEFLKIQTQLGSISQLPVKR